MAALAQLPRLSPAVCCPGRPSILRSLDLHYYHYYLSSQSGDFSAWIEMRMQLAVR
ncbi:MAG TPA: hypothetical protein V6C71_20435 [Coleofasciculaceae cyanobacterium]